MSLSGRPDHKFRVTEGIRCLGASVGNVARNLTFDLWVKSSLVSLVTLPLKSNSWKPFVTAKIL
jgi:hypothetical protein